MSNKFNEYGSGGDGGDATNGSLDIWGYSLRATNMDNNSSIKTNSIGQLISSNLNISDVNNLQSELDATIQNPNNSVLVTDGLTISTGNVLKADLISESTLGQNVNLASGSDLYTNNLIVTGNQEIKTNNIGEASLDGGMNILSNVNMSSKEIQNCELIKVDNIQSKNLIDDVVCGSNIDMFVKDIKNVNDITAVNVLCDNIKEKTVAGGINILNNVDMNLKTLNNVSNLETSTMTAQGVSTQILAPNPIFDATKVLVSGNLDMSSNNITNVNDTQTQSISTSAGTLLIKPTGGQALFQKPGGGTIEFGLEDGGSQFNFKKNGATNELCSEGTDIIQFTTDCFGAVKIASLNPTTDAFQLRDYNLDMNNNDIINCNEIKTDNLTSSTTTEIKMNSDLNLNGQNIIGLDLINGIQPSGGLYSESSGFQTASTTEVNILGQGTSSGSLSIPADTFSALNMYSFKASGVLSGGTNDLFTLRAKTLTNIPSTILLGEIMVTLQDNGLVDVPWDIMIDFTIRTTGIAGVAALVLSGVFRYSNNNDVVRTFLRTIVLTSGFDTTVDNTLQLTFQNDATDPLTNFRIDQASFTKWY